MAETKVNHKGLELEPQTVAAFESIVMSPAFPKLPTKWQKSIPAILVLFGTFVGAVGTWYSGNVPQTDPELDTMISERVNVPALCSAVVGVVTVITGLFAGSSVNSKTESALHHVKSSATVAVAAAAAAPPINGNGKASVEHTASVLLVQAAQEKRHNDAGLILELIKNFKGN